MRLLRICFFLTLLSLCSFIGVHKYYISVTQLEYVESSNTVQMTSRIFIDDIERLLRERYDKNITLMENDEATQVDSYLQRYLSEKIKVKINNESVDIKFLGKEYDADIMRCYIEINNVIDIKTLEISNNVLFDIFEDQQNIIKTKINSKQKSFILFKEKQVEVLNFD